MEKHIQEMKRIGLQEYESKAYYVLLTQGNLNAKEISQKAKIPQPKVYTILSNLIKNLEKIYVIESTKTLDVYIEVLTNNQQIHEKYVSLKSGAKHELIAFVKPPFAHGGNKSKIKIQDEVDWQRLRKGIVSKAIYEIPTPEDASFIIPHVEKSISEGGEARMLENVPIKMHIFDERFVLMALNNSHNSSAKLTMLAIEHPDLARANKIFFEHLWEKAIPFEEYKIKYLIDKT